MQKRNRFDNFGGFEGSDALFAAKEKREISLESQSGGALKGDICLN
jgi:hypothetical protein